MLNEYQEDMIHAWSNHRFLYISRYEKMLENIDATSLLERFELAGGNSGIWGVKCIVSFSERIMIFLLQCAERCNGWPSLLIIPCFFVFEEREKRGSETV